MVESYRGNTFGNIQVLIFFTVTTFAGGASLRRYARRIVVIAHVLFQNMYG